MRAVRAAVTAAAAVQLRSARIVGKAFGDSWPERLVTCCLCLAAANLLAVLVAGGYKFTVGPVGVSAHHLRNPLLLFLALFLLKTWLRAGSLGVPRAVRLRSLSVLFLGVVFIYILNGTTAMSGDTVPARFLPLSLLQEFDFDLNEFPFLYEPQMPYFLQQIDGRIVSAYPPWAGVLALPVYMLPVFAGLDPQSSLLPELEKIAAALITALSVVILFCAVKRLTREHIAWGIAVIYALGTSSFSSSSQALFQHGPSQLFLSLTLYWLVRGLQEPRYSAYAGFALAAAVICRPVNILIALPIGAYMLHKRRAQLGGFLLAALPPLFLFVTYNIRYFGAPLTSGFGANAMGPSFVLKASSHLLSSPLWEGLMGVLVSPGRGLLIYSPILILSFGGILKVWKEAGHLLLKYLSISALFSLILVAKWMNWWGGIVMALGYWRISLLSYVFTCIRFLSGLKREDLRNSPLSASAVCLCAFML